MNKINPKSILAISLILILSISALMIIAPTVNAAVVEIETNAYVLLAPDPIGVGQTLLVSYRIDKVRIGATDIANHFEGFEVTITQQRLRAILRFTQPAGAGSPIIQINLEHTLSKQSFPLNGQMELNLDNHITTFT